MDNKIIDISPTIPPRTSEFAWHQDHGHKFKVGDRVAYVRATNKGKKNASYQFREVEILGVGYDNRRIPRYLIKVFRRVTVKAGIAKKTQIEKRRVTPVALDIDRNHFPIENWEQQIQWKVNLTNALK